MILVGGVLANHNPHVYAPLTLIKILSWRQMQSFFDVICSAYAYKYTVLVT